MLVIHKIPELYSYWNYTIIPLKSVICDYNYLLFLPIRSPDVSTPISPTVCNGAIATLTCVFSQSSPVAPAWRVFTTSDTSGSPVATLTSGDNSPPYNYPTVQGGDTVARLEVNTRSNINGYHFQCRLPLLPTPVDSPSTGTITLTGMYVDIYTQL